jgi:hypothetical protein
MDVVKQVHGNWTVFKEIWFSALVRETPSLDETIEVLLYENLTQAER